MVEESKTMNETLIKLENVKKSYGSHEVLKGVNMQVNRGDIYGLIGRNGAGKTTIFKMILGLSEANGGNISIAGSQTKKELLANRSKIGFLVGTRFYGYLNAKNNLRYSAIFKGIPRKERKDEIDRVLEIVGLKDVKKPVKNFSLGMGQRLGIANAILGNPEILILDEPANGLDPQGIADVRLSFEMAILIFLGCLTNILSTGASVSIAAVFFFLSGNTALGLIIYIAAEFIIPLAPALLSMMPFIAKYHIDRLFISGLSSSMLSDFIIGDALSGLTKLLFIIVLYILVPAVITILFFRKKELNL